MSKIFTFHQLNDYQDSFQKQNEIHVPVKIYASYHRSSNNLMLEQKFFELIKDVGKILFVNDIFFVPDVSWIENSSLDEGWTYYFPKMWHDYEHPVNTFSEILPQETYCLSPYEWQQYPMFKMNENKNNLGFEEIFGCVLEPHIHVDSQNKIMTLLRTITEASLHKKHQQEKLALHIKNGGFCIRAKHKLDDGFYRLYQSYSVVENPRDTYKNDEKLNLITINVTILFRQVRFISD